VCLQDLLNGRVMACFALGVVLILINFWSSISTYEASNQQHWVQSMSNRLPWVSVGDFGWFYGDFFIARDAFQQHLCYTGAKL
jgi:hypothetical protein